MLPLGFIVDNKLEIQKKMRQFDKSKRSTKASRERARRMRRREREMASRRETFEKYLEIRAELLEEDVKKAN